MSTTSAVISSTGVERALQEHLAGFQSQLKNLGDASNPLVLGEAVERFEDAFAASVHANHAIAVGNGLDALTLILQGLGIGPGDEVIVPAQTFHATLLAVVFAGATPVPVDTTEVDGNIDPAAVLTALSSRTAALLPVHLHGNPCDLRALSEIAARHGLAFIDDAAQAHGAESSLGKVGSGGDASAFSFYPTKNLGALGDAGAISTSDQNLAERLRSLRNYGTVEVNGRYIPGRNSRLDTIQAVWLSGILPELESWNECRRASAQRYLAGLHDLGVATLVPTIGTPVWHHLVILVSNRDAVQHELRKHGVQCGVHYNPAAFAHPAVAPFLRTSLQELDFPNSESQAARALSLPMHPWLTPSDIDRVLDLLAEVLGTDATNVHP